MPVRHSFVLFAFLALHQIPTLAQDLGTPIDDSGLVNNPETPRQVEPSPIQKTENPPELESHGTRLRWQDIPRNVLHDEKAIFTSPFHISRENAKWWGLFGGVTAGLIAVDQRISNSMPQETALAKPS